MGGVPFKSTGCNTCRRRKVKCDEAKPECMRCVKNGHVCLGYERNRVFIHRSSQGDPQKLVRRSKVVTDDPKLLQSSGVDTEIPRLNVNPEVRSQMMATFINNYLPQAEYMQNATGKNLFETLPELNGGSLLLDKAIVSLSSAFLAKQNHDDQLLQYSTRLYGNAMETLHGRITTGRSLRKDILYTTVIFQVYELINCSPPGFTAWLAHVQGSNAIMGQVVDRKEKPVIEKLFHRQLKFVSLCDAIGKRKAASLYNYSILACHDSPQSRVEVEPVDEFIDLLIECSALLEQGDRFIQNERCDFIFLQQTGNHLLHICLFLEEKLHKACLRMQEKLGMPSPLKYSSYSKQKGKPSTSADLFSDALHFPSLNCAEAHMLYWTALILVYPLIDQILELLDQPASSIGSPVMSPSSAETASPNQSIDSQPHADFTTLADHYASEICRSVLYCIQPNMKTLGAQILLAPLSQSTQFFYVQESIAKHQWCQGVFVSLSQLGLGIAPLLKDMVWPEYRDALKRKTKSSPGQVETV